MCVCVCVCWCVYVRGIQKSHLKVHISKSTTEHLLKEHFRTPSRRHISLTLQRTATHCNTLQHIATHCNTLQRTATHCNTLQRTATHRNALQHTATYCNTLQHTATHCNTLQHTLNGSQPLRVCCIVRQMCLLYSCIPLTHAHQHPHTHKNTNIRKYTYCTATHRNILSKAL